MPEVSAEFPAPLECLFTPKRTKVLYGGRGAGRSWGVARALLIMGTQRPISVLCARELQNSIAESVHKLLSNQISLLGMEAHYKVQVGQISGANGTTFSFEGIKNNTTKIKSYEAIDYCWVEEANKVSRASWSVLLPTIRKTGSEIWITFNPELDTDYTYQRFVLQPSADSFVVKMTWRDNPWFTREMRMEMEDLKHRDFDSYLNVWEGNTLQMLEGVVFAKELRRAQAQGRICPIGWDRDTPVDTFWDLGRNDMTAIWFAQRVAMQHRLLGYYENSQEDIGHYLKYCQDQPYLYGTFYLPHDAKAKRLGMKRTIEQQVRAMGRTVRVVPRINAKVNAINAARSVFPNCWFDTEACGDGLDRLRHYRYAVVDGQLSKEPLHDENSNGADAFMTFAQYNKLPGKPRPFGERLATATARFVENSPNLGWLR